MAALFWPSAGNQKRIHVINYPTEWKRAHFEWPIHLLLRSNQNYQVSLRVSFSLDTCHGVHTFHLVYLTKAAFIVFFTCTQKTDSYRRRERKSKVFERFVERMTSYKAIQRWCVIHSTFNQAYWTGSYWLRTAVYPILLHIDSDLSLATRLTKLPWMSLQSIYR